jgi:hypothetical protein
MTVSRCLIIALALSAPGLAHAEDTKKIGSRYRIKVTSAGVPTLGGVVTGYKVRTKYKVYSGDKLIGWAYLGDYVYVQSPGKYRILVNGLSKTESFEIPQEMTRDRIAASWKRSRAVELRPQSLGKRLSIPSIWVLHPPHITGPHNDNYVIEKASDGKSIARGVAVVYPPEEIKDIDDGVLFSNTLVHLMPGRYQLRINGGLYPFEVKASQAQLLRLGALSVSAKVPESLSLRQHLPDNKSALLPRPKADKWIVAVPGKYSLGKQAVVIKAGHAVHIRQKIRSLPSLRRPRLLVRAISDNGVRINGFLAGSPVAAAGLKVGDRIVAFDGTRVTNTKDLARLLLEKELGDSAVLTVERPGRAKPFKVTLQLGKQARKTKKKRKIY